MQHVVTLPFAPRPVAGGRLELHMVPSWVDNLVWLLVDPERREAAVIDGPEADAVERYAAEHDLRVTAIFNTHTHPDHIGINRAYARLGRLDALRVVGAASRDDVPGRNEAVAEGDTLRFGGVEGRVIETPGHMDGHISFVFGDALFCGDTLFGGGCGYLFDGPPAAMHASLQKLAALPEATLVCCAHEYTQDNLRFAWTVEPDNAALAARIRDTWAARATGAVTLPTTVGLERATNPFLRTHSATLRARVAAALETPLDDDPAAIFAATRALKDRKDYKALGDDHLPG